MILLNDVAIKPTIFPDKTSQIWHIPTELFQDRNTISWYFENEGEFMHVAQLASLIDEVRPGYIHLYMRTLPYARQDKQIGNDTSFAFRVFADLINSLPFNLVTAVDPHNYDLFERRIARGQIIEPHNNIAYAMAETKSVLCFPDKGAKERYAHHFLDERPLVFEKVRDQATGAIRSIELAESHSTIQDGIFLIVDDICDAGGTFIGVSEKLYYLGAKEVHLYVSHGIFSKGVDILRQSGIKRIFNYDQEVL